MMEKLIIRSSEFPIRKTTNTAPEKNLLLEFQDYQFALFLASQGLSSRAEHIKAYEGKDVKVIHSLKKYASRAQHRATPFGAFASCSLMRWGEKSIFDFSESPRITLGLDLHLLGVLTQELLKNRAIRKHLSFQVNHTVYHLGDKTRYVEFYYKSLQRYHKISETEKNEVIDFLCSEFDAYSPFDTIIKKLAANFEVNLDEAQEYIHVLIDEGLLISNVNLKGIESNSLEKLLVALPEEQAKKLQLFELNERLKRINQTNFRKTAEAFKKVLAEYKNIPQEGNLFQATAERLSNRFTLDKKYKRDLNRAIAFMKRFNPSYHNSSIIEFCKAFTEFYGDQHIPLMEALDPYVGLGYPVKKKSDDEESDLDDLIFTPSTESYVDLRYYKPHQLLFYRLEKAIRTGKKSIQLDENDLESANEEPQKQLPPSFSGLWSITSEDKIHLKYCGNNSGTSLIGRFGNNNKEIQYLLEEISQKETEIVGEDVILAEINHIPEDRLGNVVQRPSVRKNEIPIVTSSNCPKEDRIDLKDIMLYVQGNKAIIYSKKRNKIVIPRLMNAHNFSHSKMPAYRFLAELQFQDIKSNLSFSWGVLEKQFHYFPRVEYGKVILHPEMWRFMNEEMPFIKENSEELLLKWRKEENLPDRFYLVEGDNHLLIDFNESLSRKVFMDEVRKKPEIKIHEYLGTAPIQGLSDRTTEFLSIHYNNNYRPLFTQVPAKGDRIQHTYNTGDKWIYYKAYGLFSNADKVLSEYFLPLYNQLKSKGIIDAFFFIKYTDPREHLRIRFKAPEQHIERVNTLLIKVFNRLIHAQLIQKYTNDRYVREVNRYGVSTIEHCERWFEQDSVCTIKYMSLHKEFPRSKRWLFAFLSIQELMNDLELSEKEQLELSKRISSAFRSEFNINKSANKVLDKKYRQLETEIISAQNVDFYRPIHQLLKERSAASLSIFESIKKDKDLVFYLAPSLIHMLMNRLFITNQRQYETIVYDFLHRYLKKQVYRRQPTH